MTVTAETSLLLFLEMDMVSRRAVNCCAHNQVTTLGELHEWKLTHSSFLEMKNAGKKVQAELEELLTLYDRVQAGEQPSWPESSVQTVVTPDEDQLRLDTFLRHHAAMITPAKEELLALLMQQQVGTLSVRARHAMDGRMENLSQLLPYFAQETIHINFVNGRSKTDQEIERFVQSFRQTYGRIAVQPESETVQELVSMKFPFLSPDQALSVAQYHDTYGHYPFFRLATDYLLHSDSKALKAQVLYYGIGHRPPLPMDNIGKQLHLTRERIRQLLSDSHKSDYLSALTRHCDLSVYPFMSADYISDRNEMLWQTAQAENLDCDFTALCGIIDLSDLYHLHTIGKRHLLVSRSFGSVVDVPELLKQAEQCVTLRRTQPQPYPLSHFIHQPANDALRTRTEQLLTEVFECYYDQHVDNGVVTIEKNRLDKGEELCKILRSAGRPMSLVELFDQYCAQLPDTPLKSITSLRSLLYRTPQIVSLGKTSTYALAEWGLFSGTIIDRLLEILQAEPLPVSLDALTRRVQEHFPSTNAKSVTSLMYDDDRFVLFPDNYYGSSAKSYPDTFRPIAASDRVVRKPFADRFTEFRAFVDRHHHLPTSNGEHANEIVMYRWYRNVLSGNIDVTPEQFTHLHDYLRSKDHLPHTAAELHCMRMCQLWESHVRSGLPLPGYKQDANFARWFYYAVKKRTVFNDRRDRYIRETMDRLGY